VGKFGIDRNRPDCSFLVQKFSGCGIPHGDVHIRQSIEHLGHAVAAGEETIAARTAPIRANTRCIVPGLNKDAYICT